MCIDQFYLRKYSTILAQLCLKKYYTVIKLSIFSCINTSIGTLKFAVSTWTLSQEDATVKNLEDDSTAKLACCSSTVTFRLMVRPRRQDTNIRGRVYTNTGRVAHALGENLIHVTENVYVEHVAREQLIFPIVKCVNETFFRGIGSLTFVLR